MNTRQLPTNKTGHETDPSAEATLQHENTEVYEGDTALLPEMDSFGLFASNCAVPAERRKKQPDALEIHYICSGYMMRWTEHRGNLHEVRAGQTFVIPHGTPFGERDDVIQPNEHYWLRIRLPQGKALPGLSTKETQILREGIQQIHTLKAKAPMLIDKLFQMLIHEHRASPGLLKQVSARSILHTILAIVIRSHSDSSSDRQYTWRVKRTIHWIQNHQLAEKLRLDELCEDLNTSVSNLRARFKSETGFTPSEYVFHSRMKEACSYLINTQLNVTEIAFKLGASSSQYFATSFRKHIGITPSEFRARHAIRNPSPGSVRYDRVA